MQLFAGDELLAGAFIDFTRRFCSRSTGSVLLGDWKGRRRMGKNFRHSMIIQIVIAICFEHIFVSSADLGEIFSFPFLVCSLLKK